MKKKIMNWKIKRTNKNKKWKEKEEKFNFSLILKNWLELFDFFVMQKCVKM